MALKSTHNSSSSLSSSSVRLFIGFCIFFVLLLTYGRTHFYRDPGSIFYDPERAYTRQYSAFRQAQAENFIETQIKDFGSPEYEDSQQGMVKAGSNPTICASFATLKRNGVQYIENSIASALEGLTVEEREDIYVSIFFANGKPETHPSYHKPWLEKLVDSVYTQPFDDKDRYQRVLELERTSNFSAKGVLDYTYGLQHCYDNGAPYVLMFEGDVIVADGWFVKTMQALENIEGKLGKDARWLYMRLFNQERSMGWASSRIGSHNEHWIVLGIVVVLLCFTAILRRRSPSSSMTEPWSLAVLCVVIVPSLVILFFQAGKASVLPHSPGVYEEKFGCCSQALLYPRDRIPGLISYLHQRDHGQVDLMVNTYARKHGFDRMSLYPVQVQHVGIQSVRGTDEDEAQAIWSMAFEDKDPAKLETEHQELVNRFYYGGEG